MEAILMGLLSPALGFLLRKGENAAEHAIDTLGAAVWERAQAVWVKLRPSIEEDETAHQDASAIAENPDDEATKGALQFRLRSVLASDPQLADELGQILDEARKANVIADNGAVVILGDVRGSGGSVVAARDITGDVHTGSGT